MTTRILLAPIKVSVGLVKLELRIVRGVARLAFELGRESARGESRGDGAAAEAATEPASPAAVVDEPPAPRPARTTRSGSRPRGAAASRGSATARKPAARKPASTRRPATPRRPAAAAPEPAAPPAPEPAPPAPEPGPAATATGPAATATGPAATPPPEAPRRSSDPTPGELAAAREALREAEGEDLVASVGPAAHAGPEIHLDPPWEGYDAMALDEVLGRLQAADPTTLAAVRLYESTHESRQAILLATETP
jgi:hypothetical protein